MKPRILAPGSLVPAIILLITVSSLHAEGNWKRIGRKTVEHRLEQDVFAVNAKAPLYTALRFHVFKAPVHLLDIQVIYRNGERQDFKVRRLIDAGETSRVLDLQGRHRAIEKVVFTYRTESKTGVTGPRARIELYGNITT